MEVACSTLTQSGDSSSNVSWVKRTVEGNSVAISTPRASYHLYDHILVLEGVGESDSGRYCCFVEASQQDEACSNLYVSDQGEHEIIMHAHCRQSTPCGRIVCSSTRVESCYVNDKF